MKRASLDIHGQSLPFLCEVMLLYPIGTIYMDQGDQVLLLKTDVDSTRSAQAQISVARKRSREKE